MNSSETMRDSDPQPSNPIAGIRENIYSMIDLRPTDETKNTLVYINEMDEETFMNGGMWSSSLKQAIDEGRVTCETHELDIDEMDERQQDEATNPQSPRSFYKHIIRLTSA